jgi:hypothetical protein
MKYFDVFISHSGAVPWHKELARQISTACYLNQKIPWFDENYLRYGHELSDQLIQGVNDSKQFLLLWSKEASASKFVEIEYEAALSKLAMGDEMKIVVVRLDDAPLPDSLKENKWIDWNHERPLISLQEIATALEFANLHLILNEIGAFGNYLNYDSQTHFTLLLNQATLLRIFGMFKVMLYNTAHFGHEVELRDSLKKLLETNTARAFVSWPLGVIPLGDGRYEIIKPNRMRIAVDPVFDPVPFGLTPRILESSEVHCVFDFLDGFGEQVQYLVPFNYSLSFDAEM